MARIFYKCLGRFALMTAAALWAGCNDDIEKKGSQETDSEPVLSSPFKTKEYIKQRTEDGYRNCYRGMCDSLAGTLYGSGAVSFDTSAFGYVKKIDQSDLEFSSECTLDSKSLIKVIHQRIPGLRHIYNKHLKKKLGFEGGLMLELTIGSDGSVTNAVVKSSTTGYDEFDKEIKRAVSLWKFEKSSGTTSVTIPFAFAEKYPWAE